ncbi:MAG: hypothetical protein K2G32_10055 [Oscillospiraceae bacterium]|nr:hypothetical protein [Oscillospiraceae bacterium]
MTIKELLAQNTNINGGSFAYLNVIAWLQDETQSVDIVAANKFCDEAKQLLDREIRSWYLCFDLHDIDVIELRVTI